jgi:hypothetical protein
MSNIDDLRGSLDDDDEAMPASTIIGEDDDPVAVSDGRFLGMTAGERAMLSVLLFLASLLLGAGVLIVTGRVVL